MTRLLGVSSWFTASSTSIESFVAFSVDLVFEDRAEAASLRKKLSGRVAKIVDGATVNEAVGLKFVSYDKDQIC